MLLSDINTGETCVIVKVNGNGAFRKRILEMGFVRGKSIKAVLNAPLKDPIKYKIMDYEVSLRRSEAALIEVKYPDKDIIEEIESLPDSYKLEYESETEVRHSETTRDTSKKVINVALVGNPNSGKTTLFNYASGAHEHVGNYSGVTVDSKEGTFKHNGYTFNIVDLPGTYSMSAYTPEELFVRRHIMESEPDVIINIVAASNLERNLYLTTELIDMQVPTIVALNMYDELLATGSKFDYEKLSRMVGIPIVPTVSKTGKGVDNLFEKIILMYEGKSAIERKVNVYYGNVIENAISRLNIQLGKQTDFTYAFPTRYISIKLLEKDVDVEAYIKSLPQTAPILKLRDDEVKTIEERYKEDTESILTNARYGFIAGGLKETLEGKNFGSEFTRVLDSVVTHKIWGFPIFFAFMFLMFACTFLLGEYPMGWIESGVEWLGNFMRTYMPDGMLKDLICDGIIGGVGEVIVFLPNIVILYAFISFMEDSGYMARAAFIMDKVMHKMGLHGKSFIPLIMGFGCNVPAIMASRTIESKNSRMITILVNPFMSCTARLPVYILFAGIFFGPYATLALFGLYVFGIMLAVLSARIFKRFMFKGEDTPFVMELPPYRMPTAKAVLIHMWDKSKLYLKKMGGIILIASIIIWFLGYFPQNEAITDRYESKIAQIEESFESKVIDEDQKTEQIADVEHHWNTAHQESSYIGIIGKAMEPIVKPLGFDWKIGVSLFSGLAAKEIVISTLGVLYTGDGEDHETLSTRLPNEVLEDGTPAFTTLKVISLLLFVLIYFPCVATVAAIKEETGTWKWGVFSMVYTTGLAWIISFTVYQVGTLLGF